MTQYPPVFVTKVVHGTSSAQTKEEAYSQKLFLHEIKILHVGRTEKMATRLDALSKSIDVYTTGSYSRPVTPISTINAKNLIKWNMVTNWYLAKRFLEMRTTRRPGLGNIKVSTSSREGLDGYSQVKVRQEWDQVNQGLYYISEIVYEAHPLEALTTQLVKFKLMIAIGGGDR